MIKDVSVRPGQCHSGMSLWVPASNLHALENYCSAGSPGIQAQGRDLYSGPGITQAVSAKEPRPHASVHSASQHATCRSQHCNLICSKKGRRQQLG